MFIKFLSLYLTHLMHSIIVVIKIYSILMNMNIKNLNKSPERKATEN